MAPRKLDDAVVETLGGRVNGSLELVGDQAVGSTEERLGGPVELLAKSIRCFLADRAHAVFELEGAGLGPAIDLARDSPLDLLHLAPLELRKRNLDPRSRLALCVVDLLCHRMLVLAEPLRHVVDRAPPVVGLRLELVERLGERILRTRLQGFAQEDGGCTLLVDCRSESSRSRTPSSPRRWSDSRRSSAT